MKKKTPSIKYFYITSDFYILYDHSTKEDYVNHNDDSVIIRDPSGVSTSFTRHFELIKKQLIEKLFNKIDVIENMTE